MLIAIAARCSIPPLALLAGALVVALAGCGAGRTSSTAAASRAESQPAPDFTPQQKRVEQGAPLIVAYGCAACHLSSTGRRIAPSFLTFAGHEVTLADGHRTLVDEAFLRKGLLLPGRYAISGYDPAPRVDAVRRLHLARHPQQVAALVAFIEQVGPETE
ncbi:MAG: hypothetical protein ACLQBB_12620 [Solirubrobacteraceae bacterium]